MRFQLHSGNHRIRTWRTKGTQAAVLSSHHFCLLPFFCLCLHWCLSLQPALSQDSFLLFSVRTGASPGWGKSAGGYTEWVSRMESWTEAHGRVQSSQLRTPARGHAGLPRTKNEVD